MTTAELTFVCAIVGYLLCVVGHVAYQLGRAVPDPYWREYARALEERLAQLEGTKVK